MRSPAGSGDQDPESPSGGGGPISSRCSQRAWVFLNFDVQCSCVSVLEGVGAMLSRVRRASIAREAEVLFQVSATTWLKKNKLQQLAFLQEGLLQLTRRKHSPLYQAAKDRPEAAGSGAGPVQLAPCCFQTLKDAHAIHLLPSSGRVGGMLSNLGRRASFMQGTKPCTGRHLASLASFDLRWCKGRLEDYVKTQDCLHDLCVAESGGISVR